MVSNYIILGMLLSGITMVVCALFMDSKSSFDNGSFMVQMLLIIVGIAFLGIGLLWHLVKSLLMF